MMGQALASRLSQGHPCRPCPQCACDGGGVAERQRSRERRGRI